MIDVDRKEKILNQINQLGRVSTKELAEMHNVTSVTIRNDLNQLYEQNLITRISGGAISKNKSHREMSSDIRQDINKVAKTLIGKKAIEYIKDGQTILLDTGTTSYHIARNLQGFKNLVIITNDFNVAKVIELFSNSTVLFLGGIVKSGYHCTYHNHHSSTLKTLNIDVAFMGVNGLTTDGAFVADIQLSQTKQLMVSRSNKVIVCCDSAKFDNKSLSRFAKLDEIDIVISDALPNRISRFQEYEMEWVICNK